MIEVTLPAQFRNNSASNRFKVQSSSAGTLLQINAGNGGDTVDVGDATDGLDKVAGTGAGVRINVTGSSDTHLILDDQATQNAIDGFPGFGETDIYRNNPVYAITDHQTYQQVQRTNTFLATEIFDDAPTQVLPPKALITTVTYTNVANVEVDGANLLMTNDGGVNTRLPQYSTRNVFDVQGVAAGTNVTIRAGAGKDQVNVGSDPVNVSQSVIDGIQGLLTLYGAGGNTSMAVYDQGTTTRNGYDVADSWFDRFLATGSRPAVPQITYHNLAAVTVNTGSAGNVIGVESTAAGTNTLVNGNGGGSDETIVDNFSDTLDDSQGPLHFHEVSPSSLFIVDYLNTVGHTYTLTAGQVQRDGIAPITYDNMGQVVVSTSNNPYDGHTPNTVNVQGLGPNVFAVPEVGTRDTVTVGQNGSVANILGDLRIQSVLGQVPKQVTLDDSSDANPHTITLGGDAFFGYLINGLLPASSLGRGRIGLSVDPATPVSIRTGSGNDTFQVHDLIGIPALALDAGGGNNTLDYSAYKGDVKVNLGLGTATGQARISRIQNVTGGIGNSLLVGDANANRLIGGTGRNIIIGGGGADTLSEVAANTGDNMLIAGTTSYDSDPAQAALDAVFAEWTNTQNFDDRYSSLKSGITINGRSVILDKTTVHDDTADAATTLTLGGTGTSGTGAGRNWVFLDNDVSDTITNPRPAKLGDKTTKI